MRQRRAWLIRLATLFGTGRREQEMAEELESHLEIRIGARLGERGCRLEPAPVEAT